MGLELLSVSLALGTFRKELEGRRVVLHSDNSGAEVAIRKGCARSHDHCQLVHAQWLALAQMRTEVCCVCWFWLVACL